MQKLGIKAGARIVLLAEPPDYTATLGELPPDVLVEHKLAGKFDFVHIFATTKAGLEKKFAAAKSHLLPDGLVWISWPKKAAKMKTDLNENLIREIGLGLGLVDVKVCAVDETWSGLKFVYRLQDRAAIKSK